MIGRNIGLYPTVFHLYVIAEIGGCAVFCLKLERDIARLALANLETKILELRRTDADIHLFPLRSFPVAVLRQADMKHFPALITARGIGVVDDFHLDAAATVRFPLADKAVFKVVDEAFCTSTEVVFLNNMKVPSGLHVVFLNPTEGCMETGKAFSVLTSVHIEQLALVNGEPNMVELQGRQHLYVFLFERDIRLL